MLEMHQVGVGGFQEAVVETASRTTSTSASPILLRPPLVLDLMIGINLANLEETLLVHAFIDANSLNGEMANLMNARISAV